jgi:hypothetical protein
MKNAVTGNWPVRRSSPDGSRPMESRPRSTSALVAEIAFGLNSGPALHSAFKRNTLLTNDPCLPEKRRIGRERKRGVDGNPEGSARPPDSLSPNRRMAGSPAQPRSRCETVGLRFGRGAQEARGTSRPEVLRIKAVWVWLPRGLEPTTLRLTGSDDRRERLSNPA